MVWIVAFQYSLWCSARFVGQQWNSSAQLYPAMAVSLLIHEQTLRRRFSKAEKCAKRRIERRIKRENYKFMFKGASSLVMKAFLL